MLSRPWLQTALWLSVLLLALIPLRWVMRPVTIDDVAMTDAMATNQSLVDLTGFVSWKSSMPIKCIQLTVVTADTTTTIIDVNEPEQEGDEWLEALLPQGLNTYVLNIEWFTPAPSQAFEIKLTLGQQEEKSWVFWSDESLSLEQVIEF